MKPCLRFLCALGLLVAACADPETAGGTASEGESFVYGYVQDSSVTAALQRTMRLAQAAPAQVVLSREAYGTQGLETQWSDTVAAGPDGYFAIALPDSGQYTLSAVAPTGAATVYAEIQYQSQGQDLGRLGLYPLVTLAGSLDLVPACAGGLRLSMPGRPDFSTLASDGSFALSQVSAGRSVLLVQCADTVQQWPLHLPGSCPAIHLDGIPWTGSSTAAGQGVAQGSGFNAAPDSPWKWRQRTPLTVDADCQLVTDKDSPGGPQNRALPGVAYNP